MSFLLILFLLSSVTWVLSYLFLVWPSLLSPLLWLIGSTAETGVVASYVVIVAFSLQLILLILVFVMQGGRKKLQKKFLEEASKNIALSERTKSIAEQLSKQEKELKQSQSEAQQLVIYKERSLNLQQLSDELRTRTQELEATNARLSKEILQLRSGKPAGFFSSVQEWFEKILP